MEPKADSDANRGCRTSDEGRVVEDGTHAELMAREDGNYRRFVDLQTASKGGLTLLTDFPRTHRGMIYGLSPSFSKSDRAKSPVDRMNSPSRRA